MLRADALFRMGLPLDPAVLDTSVQALVSLREKFAAQRQIDLQRQPAHFRLAFFDRASLPGRLRRVRNR